MGHLPSCLSPPRSTLHLVTEKRLWPRGSAAKTNSQLDRPRYGPGSCQVRGPGWPCHHTQPGGQLLEEGDTGQVTSVICMA